MRSGKIGHTMEFCSTPCTFCLKKKVFNLCLYIRLRSSRNPNIMATQPPCLLETFVLCEAPQRLQNKMLRNMQSPLVSIYIYHIKAIEVFSLGEHFFTNLLIFGTILSTFWHLKRFIESPACNSGKFV